jgi:hypothetical protein
MPELAVTGQPRWASWTLRASARSKALGFKDWDEGLDEPRETLVAVDRPPAVLAIAIKLGMIGIHLGWPAAADRPQSRQPARRRMKARQCR